MDQKILIIKLSSLGDIVHGLPVLRSLKKENHEYRVSWLVEDKFKGILLNDPDIDQVFTVDTQKWRKKLSVTSLIELFTLIRKIRREKFDIAIDMQGLLKSAFLTFFSGAKIKLGFRAEDCRERLSALFYNKRAELSTSTHVVDKNLDLLKALSIQSSHVEFSPFIKPESKRMISSHLEENALSLQNTPWVAIHPGVGYQTKAWPLERFAELADRIIRELETPVLLAWGPGLDSTRESIVRQMKETCHLGPETRSIGDAMALYIRSATFISGDTGPLHLSAAMGVPTVSIFGPTDPARNGPYGNGHRVVVNKQHCSFCFKRKCVYNHECMDSVSVDQVFNSVKLSLRRKNHLFVPEKTF